MKTLSDPWVEYFSNVAEAVKLKSKDKHTKIGCVIVGKDKEIVSTGYNSFPRGINDDVDERYERPNKYDYIEHSERNAIYNAARIGVSTKGCSLILTGGFPCVDCARAIIQAGIESIYVPKNDVLKKSEKNRMNWDDKHQISQQLLKEANITIHYY